MSTKEIVDTFITALQSGDFDLAASYLSDDFVCSGFGDPIPDPVHKQEFLGLQSALHAAMPDLSYNLDNVQEQGDMVMATIQITGTQRGDLALPLPGGGIRVFPSSGNAVILPQENTEFVVEGGKVTAMQIQHMPGGGIPGILQQIAGDLPPMSGTPASI